MLGNFDRLTSFEAKNRLTATLLYRVPMSGSGPTSPKQPEWQKLYEAALLELDRTALPSRIQAARAAIHSRIVELRTSQPTEDDSRLENALKILDSLMRMYD